MNDILQQLVSMGPGIGAAVSGDGNAFAAFMDGYQRTQQQLMQQKRLQQQDALSMEDRQLRINDREAAAKRQAELDAIAAQERTQQQALRGLQIPGHLAEMGAAADDPQSAQAIIESAMPNLMKAFGQESMAYGQPAVEMAQRAITGRQKKQVEQFVEAALKTAHVADNPEADPEVQLPEHISRIVGKPSARLSELQSFAQLPIGKPAKPKSTANPTAASLAYEAAGGDAGKALGLLNPEKPEKPAKVGYRWLVQGDGEPFEWPDDKPAPRGAKPYDQVGARKLPADGAPSAYSVERANRTISSVDQLMSKVNRWTTGIGSVLSGIPETDARNFRAELDTLKANIAFNELTAMREASKTGGALGAVSDREMNLLQSALGALDAGQSPENIRQQLQKIKESVQRWQSAQHVQPAISHTPTTAPKKNPFRP